MSDGDIVFARTVATTGKSFLIKNPPLAIFASYLIKLQINNTQKLLPEFLILFFQTKTYWDNINFGLSGSAQGGFNATKLSNISIPIPSLKEQQSIVAILDEAFAAIEKANENAEKNLQNARELFESYLQSVFSNHSGEWEEKTVGEMCILRSGTTLPPDVEKPIGDFLYLKVADMNLEGNETYILTSSRFVNKSDILVSLYSHPTTRLL